MLREVKPPDAEYRELLAQVLKASGQYLIDHAPELVGRAPLTTGFQVILHVQQPTFDELPAIEVRQTYIVPEAVNAIGACQCPNAPAHTSGDAPAPDTHEGGPL